MTGNRSFPRKRESRWESGCFSNYLGSPLSRGRAGDAGRLSFHRIDLKLHLRRLQLGLAVGAEIEKVLLREAERRGKQRGRKALNAGIVFLHRAVEETPGRRDLVFQIGQLVLQ